jgi:ribbon-helix-helix CopG family protein
MDTAALSTQRLPPDASTLDRCILMPRRDAYMLSSMRTTIRIDDALYREVKAEAARSGRTVSEVIEDSLRMSLGTKAKRGSRAHIELPVSGGSGLMPGVDIDDGRALRDLMDEDVPIDELR